MAACFVCFMCAAKVKANTAIHAVLGSDDAEVKRLAVTLAAELTPANGGDFASDIIDGTAANAADAESRIRQTRDALLTFPFFGGEKLVWLKSANFLGDSVMGGAGGVLEALESLLETLSAGLPPGIRFLLSATEIDKRRTFYKTLSKLGSVTVCDRLDTSKAGWEEAAIDLARQLAEASRLKIEPAALELVALRTGGDRRTLTSELEKLALYVWGTDRAVTAADVQTLVPLTAAAIIFELGNALASRETGEALALLQQLLQQKESPIGILLVAIIPTFRNLLAVKELMEKHRLSRPSQAFYFGKTLEKLPPEATDHLPRKKDGSINAFALGIAAQHAHRFSIQELLNAQKNTLETNVALVSSQQEPECLLQQLIIRLTAR
ncbi:MAG: DNA polymerase III subunit delta [Verrucomicrobia bacterium]|nr:DNA polymerase III subunit delta [Verrucomicrobiota bacterium]